MENIIASIISNAVIVMLVGWIFGRQDKRIDKHDEQIESILLLLAENQRNVATLIERTKKL